MAYPIQSVIVLSIVGFLLYTLILKILSSLLKFEDRTWKLAALTSIAFIIISGIIGYLLSLVNLYNWAKLTSLIILIPLVKYFYKESWGKSLIVVVIIWVVMILLSFLMIGIMAIIMVTILGFGGGTPVTAFS